MGSDGRNLGRLSIIKMVEKKTWVFKFEDKIESWIEDHRMKWGILLFFLGILLGIVTGTLLEASTRMMTYGSVGYGLLFVIIEIAVGGSGN